MKSLSLLDLFGVPLIMGTELVSHLCSVVEIPTVLKKMVPKLIVYFHTTDPVYVPV